MSTESYVFAQKEQKIDKNRHIFVKKRYISLRGQAGNPIKNPGNDLLSHRGFPNSTIGAEGLNF